MSTRARLRRVMLTLASAALLLALAAPAFAEGFAEEGSVERQLGERILTLGSWGADVFQLQLQLIRSGYDISADGLYGRETQRAVLALQAANGLPADGVVGPATLAVLQTEGGTMEYVVQPGDSLWVLAQRFNTTMDELFTLNRLTTSVLQVNQRLLVPAPRTYTVQAGDTLSHIAQRFNTTVSELVALNNIERPDLIRAGTELRLPRSPR